MLSEAKHLLLAKAVRFFATLGMTSTAIVTYLGNTTLAAVSKVEKAFLIGLLRLP